MLLVTGIESSIEKRNLRVFSEFAAVLCPNCLFLVASL